MTKYVDGDLKVTTCDGTKPCEHDPQHLGNDSFEDATRIWDQPTGTFFLPHQCDEWVIGSREDAIKLWKALDEALQVN